MCLRVIWIRTQTPSEARTELWKVLRFKDAGKGADGGMVFPFRSLAGYGHDGGRDSIAASEPVKVGEWMERRKTRSFASDDPTLFAPTLTNLDGAGYESGFHCCATREAALAFALVVAGDLGIEMCELTVAVVVVTKIRTIGQQYGRFTVLVADAIMVPEQEFRPCTDDESGF